MAKTQSTEYIIGTDDGDTRFFESRAKARDFIEENEEKIRGRIEKRVWDHTPPTEVTQEIDEKKTEMITVKEFMAPRSS